MRIIRKAITRHLSKALFACAALLLVFVGSNRCCVAESKAWLNVRDFGASGSRFETTASTTAGSKQITVKDVGDFKVGQGVMVSRCNIHYTHQSLWGPKKKHAASQPLKDAVEIRGYDGSAGSWLVYVLDIEPSTTPAFRWTDDLGRTWHPRTPITYDWQPLSGGIEVRFGKRDWESGYVVVFGARDQLVTVIEKIEGNVLTLREAANRSADDAVVRHCDDEAIQATVDRAVKEKKNVYVPIGYYRLARGITVKDASAIVIEGQSAVDTIFDISDGEGSCFALKGGTEVTIRNFRFIGHMGFDQRDQAGHLATKGATGVWGFYFKSCNALHVSGTERVLVENCHATRMSCECFYSGGPGRWGGKEPKAYTKSLTFLRCSVVDNARNAFNNNDFAENTSILYCRIVDVGGCAWEGASRFVRFIGNYVRNAGTVAMGNIRSRDKSLEELGSGQHIVADNVFESNVPYGRCAIRAQASATQVIIRNNLFINFNSSGIELASATGTRDMPASNGIISGNIFDMTCVDTKPVSRIAVDVSASDVIVSDNQIYTRGTCDPLVTGIRLREPALNLNVHNNLIRNCGAGLMTGRAHAIVGEVVDRQTFLRTESSISVPLERRQSHCYRGWPLVWTSAVPPAISIIDSFDPETLRFTLREPRDIKVGDRFEVYPPSANWRIHDNIITNCIKPVVLNSYGSPSTYLSNNLITRGDVSGVKAALEVWGCFNIIGNHISGFDEPGSAALALYPDALGRAPRLQIRQNIFERCASIVTETQKGLWNPAEAGYNVFIQCGGTEETAK